MLRRSKLSDLATSRWANPKMSEGRVCHGRPLKSVGELMGISWEVMGSFGFFSFFARKNKTVHKSTWILKQQRIMRYDQTFGKGGPLSSCQASSWMKAFVAAA